MIDLMNPLRRRRRLPPAFPVPEILWAAGIGFLAFECISWLVLGGWLAAGASAILTAAIVVHALRHLRARWR